MIVAAVDSLILSSAVVSMSRNTSRKLSEEERARQEVILITLAAGISTSSSRTASRQFPREAHASMAVLKLTRLGEHPSGRGVRV